MSEEPEYECPHCNEPLTIKDLNAKYVTCPDCKTRWTVEKILEETEAVAAYSRPLKHKSEAERQAEIEELLALDAELNGNKRRKAKRPQSNFSFARPIIILLLFFSMISAFAGYDESFASVGVAFILCVGHIVHCVRHWSKSFIKAILLTVLTLVVFSIVGLLSERRGERKANEQKASAPAIEQEQ